MPIKAFKYSICTFVDKIDPDFLQVTNAQTLNLNLTRHVLVRAKAEILHLVGRKSKTALIKLTKKFYLLNFQIYHRTYIRADVPTLI